MVLDGQRQQHIVLMSVELSGFYYGFKSDTCLIQPPVGVLRYFMNGEIGESNTCYSDHCICKILIIGVSNLPPHASAFFPVSAKGFEYDNLYIHFTIELPTSEPHKIFDPLIMKTGTHK